MPLHSYVTAGAGFGYGMASGLCAYVLLCVCLGEVCDYALGRPRFPRLDCDGAPRAAGMA